jgi:hypothetical protein
MPNPTQATSRNQSNPEEEKLFTGLDITDIRGNVVEVSSGPQSYKPPYSAFQGVCIRQGYRLEYFQEHLGPFWIF